MCVWVYFLDKSRCYTLCKNVSCLFFTLYTTRARALVIDSFSLYLCFGIDPKEL